MKKCMLSLLTLAALVSTVHAREVGAIEHIHRNPTMREYYLFTTKGVCFKLTLCREDVFRLQAVPPEVAATDGILSADDAITAHHERRETLAFADPLNDPEKAQIVIDHISRAGGVAFTDEDAKAEWVTDKLVLVVDKTTCRWTLRTPDGRLVWRELQPLQFTGEKTAQVLSTSNDEYYYGGGQQNGHFSHKGRKIDIVADGNWNEGGHPNPAPFYLSNNRYGVLRNTFSTGAYDFTSDDSITLEHNENRFDAYYFVGDSFDRIVDLYTRFTGRPNFVCIWALEFGEANCYMARHNKDDGEHKKGELRKNEDGSYAYITPHCIDRVAKKYRAHDMPGGWLLVNDGYGCGYTQLVETVQGLKELGFYTGLWTEDELDRIEWEVGAAGTRVQKLDVAWTGPAYQWSLHANKTAWNALVQNSASRGMVWTVQGWAGTHRYSVCWTGDQGGSFDLIRWHIPTLIGSGMSGQAYATTDVDGIYGGSPETYCRDLQWKCFTPVLYGMSGWSNLNKGPWTYDEPYRSINRKYLKLKMRLMPYMYRYARQAWDRGTPIVRGMLWNFPDDRKTWDDTYPYQYMLGDWIVVAPVFSSMEENGGWRREPIYLPAGRWYDYWDGRALDGPLTIDAYPVTLDKLPLIVRGGAILPMYPEMLYNNQKPKDPLTFDIFPHGESEFELYEDDGLTRKHQLGEFARQTIRVKAPEGKAGAITIDVGPSVGDFDGKPRDRVYMFQVHSALKPRSVKADGKTLREVGAADYRRGQTGWTYAADERRGTVHIRLDRRPTAEDVTLVLEIDERQTIPASPP